MNTEPLTPHQEQPVITVAFLASIDACVVGILAFKSEFGDSAEVTEDNVRRAFEINLDVIWLMSAVTALAGANMRDAAREFLRVSELASERLRIDIHNARAVFEAELETIPINRLDAQRAAQMRAIDATRAAHAQYERDITPYVTARIRKHLQQLKGNNMP